MPSTFNRILAGLAMLTASAVAAAASAPAPTSAADAVLARIANVTTLPGSGHSWGFAALDPTRPYLFIARRENGLTVFDVERQRAVKTLDDSIGANGVVFVPAADRAYISNMDGTLTVVRLSDLVTLKRIPVSDANLNSAVYEPVSGRVIIASGRRAGQSTLYVLDPQQDRIVAQHNLDIRKIDPLLVTGDGSVLLPMRDEGKVLRLAGATLEVLSTWTFPACEQPSALAADVAQQRLFVACRGAKPVLVVADLGNGAVKSTLPITRAINALAWDAAGKQVLAPSGADGNLSVVRQLDADHYRTLGYVATRIWAHNMVFDAKRRQAYLFTMDVTQPDPGPQQTKRDPVFHADTFSVLTMALD